MSDKLFDLANTEFSISFAGKEYLVRKANLEMAIAYQKKIQELVQKNEPGLELHLAAHCLFLVLRKVDPLVTEDFVLQNLPADLDALQVITTLGFMSPLMKELMEKKLRQ